MDLNLTLRPEASLRLAPQLQYSLSLLQMDSVELLAHIQQQALENPMICLEYPAAASRVSISSQEVSAIPDTRYENSLQQDLMRQLPHRLVPEQRQLVQLLIELLDPCGFLQETDRELAEALSLPEQTVREAVQLLQSLEPAGIGARCVGQCLVLQLQRRGEDDPLCHSLAQKHLSDIAAGHFRKIAREENASLKQVEQAVAKIRQLSPHPVTMRSKAEQPRYITPDLIVTESEGKLCVSLSPTAVPSISRDPVYADLLLSSTDAQVVAYLQEHTGAYTRLEQAIAMRSSTMLSIARVILDKQEAFLRDPQQPLQPLSLYEISQQVGVHISTVSKALRDKYLMCGSVVYPLRHFLSRYLTGGEAQEQELGQDQLCRAIRELIREEDPAAPLSDQALFRALESRGLASSRRSVTFYREKLGIPSSYLRKK